MSGSAWGLGLFQSEHDYQIIHDLSAEAGVWNLEEVDAPTRKKKAIFTTQYRKVGLKQANASTARELEHAYADGAKSDKHDKELYYSIYAGLCSNPKRVQEYLESNNGAVAGRASAIEGLIYGHWVEAEKRKDDSDKPLYKLVILAASAMSLGCTLPTEFLTYLRSVYADRKRVGLMRDALKQMQKALSGSDGYKNDGTAYDFHSPGLNATKRIGGPPMNDRYVSGLINVPAPVFVVPDDVLREAVSTLSLTGSGKAVEYCKAKWEAAVGREVKDYGDEVCGGCGAADGIEGKNLQKCGKCKTRKYCGTACQRADWKSHKKVCKPFGPQEAKDSEELN